MTTTGAPKSAPVDPLNLLTDFSHYGSLGGSPARVFGVDIPRLAIVPQRLRQNNAWDARAQAELAWLAAPDSAPAAFLTVLTHGVVPFGDSELAYEALDRLEHIAPERAASNAILSVFVALAQLDHDRARAGLQRARDLALPTVTIDALQALALTVLEAEVADASKLIAPHHAALGLRFEAPFVALDELRVRFYRLSQNAASCTEALRTLSAYVPRDERVLLDQLRFHLWIQDGYGAINAAAERVTAGVTLSPRARGWLGRAHLLNHDLDTARVELSAAIQDAPSDVDPAELSEWYDGRAATRAQAQHAVSGVEDANVAIKLQPRRASYWVRRAQLHGTLARAALAAHDLEEALSIAPLDCHETILSDIAAHWFNARQYARAEQAYARAEQDSLDRALDASRVAHIFELRGASLHFLQRFDEAVQCYTRAIQLVPEYGKAYSDRGEALLELGRDEPAFADLERAISLNYKMGCTYVARAVYFQRRAQHADALRELDEAVRVWPTSAQPLELRAQIYTALGEHAKGNDDRERAAVLRAARR